MLLIAVFVVVGCAPSRNREAMSDPYPALGSVPRALVSELAHDMGVPVGAIEARSAVEHGRTTYAFARFSHTGERFQILIAAERRGDQWSLLAYERAPDFGPPRSGAGDLPLIQLMAGPERVIGGFVDPALDRLVIRDVDGQLVDTDDASDGEVLLLGGEGDQLQAIADDQVRVATPILPADLEVDQPAEFGEEARKAAVGFVRDAIFDRGDAGVELVDGIEPMAFVGPLRDVVATTDADDVRDTSADWFGYRVYLDGSEAIRIDVYLTEQADT